MPAYCFGTNFHQSEVNTDVVSRGVTSKVWSTQNCLYYCSQNGFLSACSALQNVYEGSKKLSNSLWFIPTNDGNAPVSWDNLMFEHRLLTFQHFMSELIPCPTPEI